MEWESDKEILGGKSIGGLQWLCPSVMAIAERTKNLSKGDEKLRYHILSDRLKKGELGNRFRTKDWKSEP